MTLLSIDVSSLLNWDSSTYSGELIISFIVMGIIAILAIIIGIVFSHQDPLKPDKNKFVLIVETAVDKLEAFVVDCMGKKYRPFSGYVMGLALYIIICFFVGISGLPNPLTSLTCPLSLGLCTFVLIHANAVKANHWKYFKRYVDPMPLFLPINLLSMWAPLISISLRLFGNALSGYCIMSIVYFYLREAAAAISSASFNSAASIWIAPFITPALHLYFDLFSGLIQTLIFCMLTMIWVSQEDPDDEEEKQASVKEVPALN